jgi:hypothetical protein
MPHRRTVPPADRFFARLDKFECECPNCGQMIFTAHDDRTLPARLLGPDKRRHAAALPRNQSVWNLVWNPLAQRLRCPWCGIAYYAGLMLYPSKSGARRALAAPPDATPDKRQWLAIRRRAGGFFAKDTYIYGQNVNWVIDADCTCGEDTWAPACPIHGDPAQGAPAGPST